jgi:hypothetical protein
MAKRKVKDEETEVESDLTSAGHRLGQLVGDWWEGRVIYPLLNAVASSLGLYLDNRIVTRTCRAEKIHWADVDGNIVDYDYVLELGGTASVKGVPVAFFESFWRGGARHSKDKARDDTNKLLPMRDTYPTARFLAIAACGKFTEPAKDYVRSRNVELLFISKEKIIEAFKSVGAVIEYPDTMPEPDKMALVRALEQCLTVQNQIKAAENLRTLAGVGAFSSFEQRIIGSLTSTPQEIRIYSVAKSGPLVFDSILAADDFLRGKDFNFPTGVAIEAYEYEVSFSDGSEFSRSVVSIEEALIINSQLLALVEHMNKLTLDSLKPTLNVATV